MREVGAIAKPGHVFDRVWEWEGLTSFGAYNPPNATLGIVSGRRRQGKSFLLQALADACGGLYFAATEATEADSLRLFANALGRYTGRPVETPFQDWNDAIPYMFQQFTGQPTTVVIDEFPFLSKVSPSLPSIIQRELGPGGSGRRSTARLLLCGSAMSVMGKLLSGQAPLRGRASLELVVKPFDYRDAAEFWGIDDAQLALLVHSIVGGTPAYREEFTGADVPADLADFDDWVLRTVLNPRIPLFREARYLLAEEAEIRDPALYHSVLSAIAVGNRTNGGIASFIGRRSGEITHPLNVLEDCALIVREPDLLRSGRPVYSIVEPLITFYEAIMRERWADLERGRARAVWQAAQHTYKTRVLGPHFESVCRTFASTAEPDVFGDLPSEVGAGTINDPQGRQQIQIDVVVLAAAEGNRPRRVLSLGEVKSGERMGMRHVEKLRRARELLAEKGFDTSETVLACYSAAGFNNDLLPSDDVVTFELDSIYARS